MRHNYLNFNHNIINFITDGSISSETYDQDVSEGFSFNHEAVAFECLAFGGGDVAFISADAIPKFLGKLTLKYVE